MYPYTVTCASRQEVRVDGRGIHRPTRALRRMNKSLPSPLQKKKKKVGGLTQMLVQLCVDVNGCLDATGRRNLAASGEKTAPPPHHPPTTTTTPTRAVTSHDASAAGPPRFSSSAVIRSRRRERRLSTAHAPLGLRHLDGARRLAEPPASPPRARARLISRRRAQKCPTRGFM